MNFEYSNLDKVKHLIFLQDTTTPLEKYSEITDNILNNQYIIYIYIQTHHIAQTLLIQGLYSKEYFTYGLARECCCHISKHLLKHVMHW